MVFKYSYFLIDDNFLNTRPGSPPAFSPSPSLASPRACNGCIGVINRFDELQLRGRVEGGGAVEEAPEESPRERNARKQVRCSRAVIGINVSISIAGAVNVGCTPFLHFWPAKFPATSSCCLCAQSITFCKIPVLFSFL